MLEISENLVLHTPQSVRLERKGTWIFVDPEGPNWIGTDDRGARILGMIDGKRSFESIVREYRASQGIGGPKAWVHVHDFVQSGIRSQFISPQKFNRSSYQGRGHYLKPHRLREFWFHTNNSCNLTCTHCLVSSHPGGAPGMSTNHLESVVDQAADLGVYRYYFTGGEPFIRSDIFELIERITKKHQSELIVLTNATLFRGDRLDQLRRQDPTRLKFQVSLDGSRPEINDPIRGPGTFIQIMDGLKVLSKLDFETSLTAVVTKENIGDMVYLPRLAKENGARSIHLMWLHRRGRILEGNGCGTETHFPNNEEILELVRQVKQQADQFGVVFDNYESIKLRINGRPGVKYDLGNACWDSLCLNWDGHLYPSASFSGHPSVDLGDTAQHSVRELWLESPVAKTFREASVVHKEGVHGDPFRYLTGGGDIEHSFFLSESVSGRGNVLGPDPYYGLYREVIQDAMFDLINGKKEVFNWKTGYDAPVILHAMGEGAIVCGTEEVLLGEQDVNTLHSNCVLSFDVEKPHRIIQDYYGKAAEKPQEELCCPVRYEPEETDHIPSEVIERFYGCGSPVTLAGLTEGERMVDMGSGGGIDCFIAARKVGKSGRVIGIDMTDQMLDVANRNKSKVAQNLGYDVVEFRKGYLEHVPVDDRSVDLITSNCVINLSPDKSSVFSEMWRVLDDHGRIVISDIISESPTPPRIKANDFLWGECIAGALTEEEFLSQLERAGFYGLELLKKVYWKEVEGYPFYSVTVRGYKFEKKEGCVYKGQKAIYRGPMKAVVDEEGHLFPRGEAVEVCTDTASKLSRAPYHQSFSLIEPEGEIQEVQSSGTNELEPCGPGCC